MSADDKVRELEREIARLKKEKEAYADLIQRYAASNANLRQMVANIARNA